MSKIILDKEKLEKMCYVVYHAAKDKQGIFRNGLGQFLPQFNMPRGDYNKAGYLFTMVSLERKALTRINIRNAKEIINNKFTIDWIFDPYQVSKATLEDITKIFVEDFQYNLDGFPKNYKANCQKIVKEYNSCPTNIINWKTIEESRKRLMEFKGIGTGIANLFIIYLLDAKLAYIKDPENILLKVDVHKGRLPLNTNSIIIPNSEIRRDQIVKILESAYLETCKNKFLDPCFLDAALWIIGSEVCAKRDYEKCARDCPLSKELCISNIPEDETNGKYSILDKNGRRIETRKNVGYKRLLTIL
jgi:endonuclease III